MPPETFRKEDTQPSRIDGKMILHVEKPTGTWMDSRVLHLSGLPQHSRHRLRGYPTRTRHHNQYVLTWKDEKNPGKLSINDDFKKATKSLAFVKHQEGQDHAWIPLKSGKADRRAVTFATPMAMSKLSQICGSQASSSSGSTTWWEPQQWQERRQ